MSFSRQLRILEALVRAQKETLEATRLLIEEQSGAPDSTPPSSSMADTLAPPPVDTLSTSHANPKSVNPRKLTRFNPMVTAGKALEEVRRLLELGRSSGDITEARRVAESLVAVKLLSPDDFASLFPPE